MKMTGERYYYREDGGKALVEIVRDDSDDEWERYELRILSIERHPSFGPADWAAGDEFSCSLKRGVAFGGMWTLTPERMDVANAELAEMLEREDK